MIFISKLGLNNGTINNSIFHVRLNVYLNGV